MYVSGWFFFCRSKCGVFSFERISSIFFSVFHFEWPVFHVAVNSFSSFFACSFVNFRPTWSTYVQKRLITSTRKRRKKSIWNSINSFEDTFLLVASKHRKEKSKKKIGNIILLFLVLSILVVCEPVERVRIRFVIGLLFLFLCLVLKFFLSFSFFFYWKWWYCFVCVVCCTKRQKRKNQVGNIWNWSVEESVIKI